MRFYCQFLGKSLYQLYNSRYKDFKVMIFTQHLFFVVENYFPAHLFFYKKLINCSKTD